MLHERLLLADWQQALKIKLFIFIAQEGNV